MTTIRQASRTALAVWTSPETEKNNNCVQDAYLRFIEAERLALHANNLDDAAPKYVVTALNNLMAWASTYRKVTKQKEAV